jgi:hypothetical protein
MPFSLVKNGDENQFLLKITSIGWLIYKLSTLKIWFLHDRTFPVIPVSEYLKITSQDFHILLSSIGMLLLVFIAFKSNKLIILSFLLIETALQVTDIMRWQPTAFQFYISFIAYVYQPKKFKFYLLLLLSATYIYGGLHKMNLRFVNFIWAHDILIEFLNISADIAYSKLVKAVGFIIPVFEILCGIFILTRWQKQAFFGIVFIHFVILLYISPIGINYNSAVWGWNLIMIIYAIHFILKPCQTQFKLNSFNLFWGILIYILPFLNFFEFYFPYFSFDLYTGSRYYLILNVEVKKDSPLINLSDQSGHKTSHLRLNTLRWSLEDINTPLTHNKWLYGKFVKAFENKYPELEPCYEIQYYPYKTTENIDF